MYSGKNAGLALLSTLALSSCIDKKIEQGLQEISDAQVTLVCTDEIVDGGYAIEISRQVLERIVATHINPADRCIAIENEIINLAVRYLNEGATVNYATQTATMPDGTKMAYQRIGEQGSKEIVIDIFPNNELGIATSYSIPCNRNQ